MRSQGYMCRGMRAASDGVRLLRCHGKQLAARQCEAPATWGREVQPRSGVAGRAAAALGGATSVPQLLQRLRSLLRTTKLGPLGAGYVKRMESPMAMQAMDTQGLSRSPAGRGEEHGARRGAGSELRPASSKQVSDDSPMCGIAWPLLPPCTQQRARRLARMLLLLLLLR